MGEIDTLIISIQELMKKKNIFKQYQVSMMLEELGKKHRNKMDALKDELKAQRETFSAHIESLEANISKVEIERNRLHELNGTLSGEIKSLKITASELKGERDNLKNELCDQKKAHTNEMQILNGTLSGEIESLKMNISKMEIERDEMQELNGNLSGQIESLEANISVIKTERDNLKNNLSDQKKTHKNEMQTLKDTLAAKINSLEVNISGVEKERDNIRVWNETLFDCFSLVLRNLRESLNSSKNSIPLKSELNGIVKSSIVTKAAHTQQFNTDNPFIELDNIFEQFKNIKNLLNNEEVDLETKQNLKHKAYYFVHQIVERHNGIVEHYSNEFEKSNKLYMEIVSENNKLNQEQSVRNEIQRLLADTNQKITGINSMIMANQQHSSESLVEINSNLTLLNQEVATKANGFGVILSEIGTVKQSLNESSSLLTEKGQILANQIEHLRDIEYQLHMIKLLREKIDSENQLLQDEWKRNIKLKSIRNVYEARKNDRKTAHDEMRNNISDVAVQTITDARDSIIQTDSESAGDILFATQMNWNLECQRSSEYQKKYEDTLFAYTNLVMRYDMLKETHVTNSMQYNENVKSLYKQVENMRKKIKTLEQNQQFRNQI